MEEFNTLKQSSRNAGKWSYFVLSIHSQLGVAAITDCNNADGGFYQCMRVANVQIWPQYSKKHIKEKFESMEAMLTVRVKGIPAKVGVREAPSATGPTKIYSYTMRGPEATKHTWMLRFSKYEEFEGAMHLFQAMKLSDLHLSVPKRVEGRQQTKELGEGTVEVDLSELTPCTIIYGNLSEGLAPIRAEWQQKQPKGSSPKSGR
ncbi:hypothetical protein Q4I28_006357 [Leishmania naiffi]|uniref:Uncharacterized protein n=1 Tax=Leishmania naiffi TaxID=5678 RepID=A0AAW3BG20_9TRYP